MSPKAKLPSKPKEDKLSRKDDSRKIAKSSRRTATPSSAKKENKQIADFKQRADELAALQATVLDISSPRPLPELLNLIMERSCNLLHASSGGIYLSDPENQQVNCVVSYKTVRDFAGIKLNYGEGAAGTVAKTGQPLIIDDYRNWSGRAQIYDQVQSFSAVMAVPLIWQGVVTGVIDVIRSENSTPFNQKDLELLNLFAAHAALAVENTRLYNVLEQDLNERKLAEEALRESERLLRESQSIAGLGSYALDILSGKWKSSDVLNKIFGIDDNYKRTVEGWAALIHPADRQMMIDYFTNEVVGNRSRFDKEYRIFRDNDKAERWVHGLGELELDAQNQPVKMLGTIQDITERKLVERSLSESEERYRSLFNTMEEGVAINEAVFDENGDMVDYVILDVNSAFEKQSPYSINEALGKKATDLYQISSDFVRNWWKAHILKERTAQTEYYHEPSGRWFFITTTLPEHGRFATIFLNITERKKAESALQEAEIKYRLLVERLPVAVYTSELGEKGIWHYISPQIEHLLGFSAEEWMADPGLWYQQVYPEDRDRQQKVEEQAWERHESFEGEYRMFTRDGRLIWIRDSAQILAPQNNGAPIVQGVLVDITERKHAEEDLNLSRAQLLANLNNTPNVAIQWYDRSGNILYWNPASESMYGWKSVDVIGKTLDQLIHTPEEQAEFMRILAEVQKTGKPFGPYEARIHRRDGASGWVLATTFSLPIKDEQIGFVCMDVDITERKLSEDALAASEAELRALFTSMQDVVLVIDRKGVYRKIAPTNPDLLYKPSQEMLGKNLWDIFPVEQANIFNNAIQQVLNTRQPARIEYALPIGDHLAWFATSISPMDSDNTLWVARDITELKQAGQALQESETLYRQAIEVAGAVPYYESYYDNGRLIKYEFIGEGIRQITGYGPEEFTAQLWDSLILEIVLVDELAPYSLDQAIHRVRSGENPIWKCEHRIRARNGEIRWVFEAAVELRDENGVSHGSIGTFQDITERKQAEQMQTALYEITNVAQTTISLNDLFASIHKILGILMPAENFYIAIYDTQNDLLSFPYFVDQYDKAPLPHIPAHGMTEYVLRSRRPLLATPQIFEEMINKKQVDLLGIASIDWIGVPLTVEDETFGVMVTQTYTDKIRLTQKDLELLTFVSTQVAMVIKRKQAEAAREHQLQELTGLHAIASICAFANDEDSLLTDATIIIGEVLFPEDFGFFMADKAGLLRPHSSYHLKKGAPPNEYIRPGEGLIGQTAQDGIARRVSDVRLEKNYIAASPTTLSELAVPMKAKEYVLGVINAESDRLNAFSEADERLLSTAADQIATALERIRLQNETVQRAKEFSSLYETSNALSAENDLTSLLQAIVEHAATLLNTSNGSIYLFNKSAQLLETVVATTMDIPIGTQLRLGEGVAGRVAQTQLPMRIDDYSTWEGRSPKYDGVIFHAILEVPMLFGGELIGVLTAAEMSESRRVFTEADERLLSLFAAQAAGAIHSARLQDETARRAQEFASLYETSKTLSAEHNLNTLLRSIVETAKNLLHTATSGMYLTIAGSDELELSMDTAPYIPLGSHIKFGEGLAGRVAQSRQPLRIDDYSVWEGRSKLYEGAPVRAVLEVPMLYRGVLIGVLTADEAGDSQRTFTEADEHLLSLFASQAAGAINAARLFEETRRRAEEFAGLYETTRDISIQQDLPTVLTIITKQAATLLNIPCASINLYDPIQAELELVASIGPDLPLGTRRKVGDGLAGRVVLTLAPINVKDYQQWEHRSRLFDAIPYKAMMGVPLLYGGNLLGVLDVSDLAPSIRTFNEVDIRFLSLFAGQAASAIANARLFEDLKKSNISIMSAYDTTIEGWSRAMDLRDHETEGHTLRVTDLTLKLARRLNLSESQLTHIRRGSLLHDIGKMGVPDAILLKEGNLSDEEWVIMRKHPQLAFEMLSSIDYLHDALDIPSNHHEKWDGSGYPRGLKGEQIPLAARIFAVVDVWDAVRSDRPYRKGWDTNTAVEYIKSQSGTHFDPYIVEAFLKLLHEE